MPQQIARCLFDGMAKRRRDEEAGAAEGEGEGEGEGEDRISALPDALLHHVLSFLPADQVVRTCVLAPRWRNLWMSAPVLRVTNAGSWKSAESFTDFVYHLLLFRDRSPLGELELESYPDSDEISEASRFVETWMRYAVVKCDVGVLRLQYCYQKPSNWLLTLSNTPLVSTHLRCLKLERFVLDHRFLNFSSCPALEELIIKCSVIAGAGALSFHSLKCLVIINVRLYWPSRIRISAPGLVLLHLEGIIGRTPLLENMPSLVTAFIRLGDHRCEDRCLLNKFGDCGYDLCEPCYGTQDGNKAVLLTNLSNASNLELIAEHGVGIFKRDLKWFPTFSKLKTLLLNEWSLASGLRAISCFLQHSPVLEKVTLQLNEEVEDTIELEERFIPTEKMLQHAQHLKIVEIRYLKMDERVLEVLKILNIFGITLDRINILKTNSLSDCFSFERS